MADMTTFTRDACDIWQEMVENKEYPDWFLIPEDIFEAINILPMIEFMERILPYLKEYVDENQDIHKFISKYGWYNIANDCKTDFGSSSIEVFFNLLEEMYGIIHFNKDFVAYVGKYMEI